MKIDFFWGDDEDGGCVPNCRSDFFDKTGIDLFACLFTDCGGQKYESSIPWLDEGVVRVGLVKDGVVESSDWSRGSWGVELNQETAKIYSLYDESYFATIGLDEFEKALIGWRDFILSAKKN